MHMLRVLYHVGDSWLAGVAHVCTPYLQGDHHSPPMCTPLSLISSHGLLVRISIRYMVECRTLRPFISIATSIDRDSDTVFVMQAIKCE